MIAEAFSSMFRNASLENPGVGLGDSRLSEFWSGGQKSSSGVVVTKEKALMLAAVYQGVSLISGDVSKLPLYPFKRLPEDDREIASKHRAYFATAVRANPQKSAKRFWRDIMVHVLLWSNGYGYISMRNGLFELYNLLPDRTAPEYVEVRDPSVPGGIRTELVYATEVAGKVETLMPHQVLHIRGISLDGMKGADLTSFARDAWGLALAAQNFESKFFRNGARVGGILEVPAGMTKPAAANVEEGFRKTYEEGDNPFKTVILREGAKFHAGQVSPQQGQVVELKDSQKREVASFFNLPPSKLGIRDSVSYNSFEQDNLAYRHGCLHHWTGDIADECDMKLLTEKELRDDSHYFEHNYSRFEQADWLTLNNGLEVMRRNEIINADEWRRKLNMNKRPDGKGGEYINPNTRSAATAEPPEPDNDQGTTDDAKARAAHRGLIADTINRMSRRVGRDARNASKSDSKLLAFVAAKAAEHRPIFDEALQPVLAAYAATFKEDLGAAMEVARVAFFDAMLTDLAAISDARQSAADLQRSVDSYFNEFERHAGERVATAIMEQQA